MPMTNGANGTAAPKSRNAVRDVFILTLTLNVLVTAGKLACGYLTSSLSMTADGYHSALDAAANVLGIIAVTFSAKPPDEDHPYGHRKFEAMGAIGISFMMFFASWEVMSEAIHRMSGHSVPAETTVVSYVVMAVTIAVNLFLTKYEQRKAKELGNSLLSADAQHTATDIYVSVTVITTLIANQLHWPALDLIGCVVIVGIILHAGYTIITAQLGYIMDQAVLEPGEVSKIVLAVPGVKGCHKIRSRGTLEHIFIDLHVQVDSQLTIEKAHDISYAVEDKLREAYPGAVDVLVHVEDDSPDHHKS